MTRADLIKLLRKFESLIFHVLPFESSKDLLFLSNGGQEFDRKIEEIATAIHHHLQCLPLNQRRVPKKQNIQKAHVVFLGNGQHNEVLTQLLQILQSFKHFIEIREIGTSTHSIGFGECRDASLLSNLRE